MALTSVEDLDRISKSLEKMASNKDINVDRAKRYLYRLRDTQITLAVLQETRLGIVINKLRRAADDEDIVAVARDLIKSWKKLLPESEDADSQSQRSATEAAASVTAVSSDTTAPTNGSAAANSGPPDVPATSVARKRPAEEPLPPTATEEAPPRRSSSDDDGTSGKSKPKTSRLNSAEEAAHRVLFGALKVHATSDPMRLKCRDMLKVAIETLVDGEVELPQDSYDPECLAAQLESAIFKEFLRSDDSKYKNRVRSRVLNLKDRKNKQLRENLLLGSLRPERLACMSAEEMASDEMRKIRERYTKQGIDDHQLAVTSGTKTSLISCKRCKGNSCMYNQVQTRSADEPMTTFVWCNDCGLRWKFC